MDNVLMHHGILGMKWGVRRTPEQLGHVSGNNSAENNVKAKTDNKSKSEKKKTVSSLSDEELRQRIQRLNMEEQYSNLVARQKDRDTSKLKKLASKALESLASKGFDYAVNLAADKLFNKNGEMTIADWENADLRKMDSDTLEKVAKMSKNLNIINSARKNLATKHDDNRQNDNESSASIPNAAETPNHDDKGPNKEASTPKPTVTKKAEADAFIPPVTKRTARGNWNSGDHNSSREVPWLYRKSGTAAKKERERYEEENRKRRERIEKANLDGRHKLEEEWYKKMWIE